MKTHIKNLFLLPALIAGLGLILAGRVTAQIFGGPQFIHPSADARILSFAPNQRDGATAYLSVYNDGGNNIQRTLIQFDLSALGTNAVVTNATLKLYADASLYFGGNPSGQVMEIYRLTQPWNETELTWSNRTATTPWTTTAGDFVGTKGLPGADPYATNNTVVPDNYQALSPKELDWNITELVKEWYAGAHPNYGLLLLSHPGNKLTFHSQESSAGIPVLEVYDANHLLPARPVYSADFEGAVGAEWSSTRVSTTPIGTRKFLGNFGNQLVRLTLTNLPPHTALELAFDLFVIQSWDGNNTFFGPDLWDLRVAGGPILLHSTFAHALPDNYIYPDGQAYPGDFPGGRFRPFTGAAEVGTLGYTFGNLGPMNSVYRHTFGFSHVGDTVQLQFSASGLQALTDESWGLDNVQVRAYGAPAGVLQFSRPYFAAAEDGTNAIVTLGRVGGSSGMVSAQVTVVGGTAHAGLDFVAPASQIFFADGETNKTLLIPLLNDTIPEPDKAFSIALSQPAGGVLLGSQSQTTVLLEDDDSTIAFAVTNVLSSECDANARVTVTRTGYTNAVAVARARTIADQGAGAATQGVDFDSTELRVVFQPGEISKDVFIPLHDDGAVGPDKTLRFQLSLAFGARLRSQSNVNVMILDNDTSAGVGRGANWQVQTLVVQSDGKFLIGGGFNQVNAAGRSSIARLNADGSLDTTFNPGSGANNWIEAIAVQPDGRILIGGWFTTFNGAARNRIARLNADGSLDNTFDPGAGADNTVYKVVAQPDGKILLAGAFINARGASRNRIARLNSGGTLDTTFNPGTGADNTLFQGLALQTNGQIIVSGAFSTFNGAARLRLARLNPDGSVDNTFSVGSGMNARANAIVVLSGGKILLGGLFTTYNGVAANRVARLNPDGTLDQTFSVAGGPNSTVQSMNLQSDGKIVVGGSWSTWNGVNRGGIVRLNLNGSLDNTFAIGYGANTYVGGVGILADGRVALAGNFTVLNGYNRTRLAIVGADGSQPPEPIQWTQWKTADGGNDHWYALTSRPENWNEAEAEAVAQGGHLGSVNTAPEQTFLESTFLKGLNRIRPFWIGLNDAASEGNFVWSSGEALTFLNWEPGEPNNGAGVRDEDYVALNWTYAADSGDLARSRFGSWNDLPLSGLTSGTIAGPHFGIMETAIYPSPPSILTQPQGQLVAPGATASFSVIAAGTGTLTYHWRKNGPDLANATNSSLAIINAQTNDAGTYSVVVSNALGSIASSNAVLLVLAPPTLTPGQLVLQPGASATLSLTVPIGVRVVVEASPDLQHWATVADTVTSSSSLIVNDPAAATAATRFYRVKYSLP